MVEAAVVEPVAVLSAEAASSSSTAAGEAAGPAPGPGHSDSDVLLEASISGEDVEGEVEPVAEYPEVPEGTARAAGLQYLAAGLAHAAAACLAAYAALASPQLLLPAAAASDPLAPALLGCLAAAWLRAAGVFLHLQGAAANGELLCWRHQRLAALTALYGLVAAATQAFGPASLQLAGLQLLLALCGGAVVLHAARSAASVAPFVSWVALQALEEGGSPGAWLGELWLAAVEAVSTVAGVLLLATAGLSLWGFAHVALGAAPAPPELLGDWPGAAAGSLAGWAVGLRRLVGAGMLLAAAQAAALLDFASFVRRGAAVTDLEQVKATLLEYLLRSRDRMAKYFLPHPATYTRLNLAFLAAAALQAAFVLAAPAAGVDVNWDGALWGPLYGTWMLGLLYGAAAALTFDWSSAAELAYGAVAWGGQLVLRFFNAFVWKFEWSERVKRA